MGLKTLKERCIFCTVVCVWLVNAVYFALVEINKKFSITLPRWKGSCQRRSGDQPQPGSLPWTIGEGRENGKALGTMLANSYIEAATQYHILV